MRRVAVKQVDAFTEAPSTGNPAAVVSEAEAWRPDQMQSIAREMNALEGSLALRG